jgi:FKBP-type peptidyl-prolyl cis-trans isomerase (trigger factor)
MAAKKQNKEQKTASTVARSDDGTIQLTFIIPRQDIQKARKNVTSEIGKTIQVPGFRKGKAPTEKVMANIPENTLVERVLQNILPKLLADAIKKHKLRPAVYPRFELVSAKKEEDWQIRAVTCELPEINLGDYKKIVSGALRAKSIWTPEKGDKKETKELSRAEKEQEVIKTLIHSIKFDIPKLLLDEEINHRLSSLLQRLEKLGLSLESYLASIRKTADDLRKEYAIQAGEAIKIELILNKISEEEKIEIDEKQVEATIKASSADPKLAKKLDTEEQRRLVRTVLRRRAALDYLVALV